MGRRGTRMEEVCIGIGMSDRGLHVASPLLCLLKVLKPTRGKSSPKVAGLGQGKEGRKEVPSEGTWRALFQPLPSVGHGSARPNLPVSLCLKALGLNWGGEEGHKWGERGVGLPGAKITGAADVGGLAALLPKAARTT